MSNRIVAALGTATLAVGILIGAASAVLIGNTSNRDRTGMDGSMGQMMTMMGGPMMGGAGFEDMAERHAQHHGTDR